VTLHKAPRRPRSGLARPEVPVAVGNARSLLPGKLGAAPGLRKEEGQ